MPSGNVTSLGTANSQQIETGPLERCATARPLSGLDRYMERYQQADPEAPGNLINAISPALLRFFRSESDSRKQADDLLQETWIRIHRLRHTSRPGEPVLPWVYAIARRVRIDGYRRTCRVRAHETTMEVVPELPQSVNRRSLVPDFETL